MTTLLLPATEQLRETFHQEVTEAGGTVSDIYQDPDCMFLRAVLPRAAEVRPGDPVQGGVAMRVAGPEILVHPYVFRQVCRNGAIVAQALGTERLERVEAEEWMASAPVAEDVLAALRATVSACLGEDVFMASRKQMRAAVAVEAEAGQILTLMSHFPGLPQSLRRRLLADILNRFTREGDSSVFGLMNAVTAVARDTRDPELRWRLEELGGGVPALLAPRCRPDTCAALPSSAEEEPDLRSERRRRVAAARGARRGFGAPVPQCRRGADRLAAAVGS
jgi:hypothetical protein